MLIAPPLHSVLSAIPFRPCTSTTPADVHVRFHVQSHRGAWIESFQRKGVKCGTMPSFSGWKRSARDLITGPRDGSATIEKGKDAKVQDRQSTREMVRDLLRRAKQAHKPTSTAEGNSNTNSTATGEGTSRSAAGKPAAKTVGATLRLLCIHPSHRAAVRHLWHQLVQLVAPTQVRGQAVSRSRTILEAENSIVGDF